MCCLPPCRRGEHHRLFGPLSQQRAFVNKLNLCNLADGEELQSPGWLVSVAFPVFGAQWKHSYYDQKDWTHRLQWQPVCFVIWMMKLMYGLLVCAQQPQSFCQVMNSINTVGYWKRPGHTRSHLNSSFPFSSFSIFGTSQINCIVFRFVLSFLSSFSRPSSYRPHSLCVTFNKLKGMQECAGNTWQSTFERLRLTNGIVVSHWLCLPPFSFSASVHPSKRLWNEHCNRSEIRIGCELDWRLVCRLKMPENGRWGGSRGKTGGQMNNEREGHK